VLRGRVDPDDVARELAAQVAAARAAGLHVGHLDGHQHLHLLPPVADVVLDLAVRCDVPAVRVVGSASWRPPAAAVRVLGRRTKQRARAAGRLVPDRAAGLDHAGRLDESTLATTIGALAGSGIADLTTHPGADPDPDRARYRWGYRWSEELRALCSAAARQAVRRAGFTLTDYVQLCATGPR
jgi:predicted glycoside hydrolase/deacetylase ChbG (UPF0249 family)